VRGLLKAVLGSRLGCKDDLGADVFSFEYAHLEMGLLGHEDGIISFAENFPQAAFTMINTLVYARQLK
jgi:hypothetical protein